MTEKKEEEPQRVEPEFQEELLFDPEEQFPQPLGPQIFTQPLKFPRRLTPILKADVLTKDIISEIVRPEFKIHDLTGKELENLANQQVNNLEIAFDQKFDDVEREEQFDLEFQRLQVSNISILLPQIEDQLKNLLSLRVQERFNEGFRRDESPGGELTELIKQISENVEDELFTIILNQMPQGTTGAEFNRIEERLTKATDRINRFGLREVARILGKKIPDIEEPVESKIIFSKLFVDEWNSDIVKIEKNMSNADIVKAANIFLEDFDASQPENFNNMVAYVKEHVENEKLRKLLLEELNLLAKDVPEAIILATIQPKGQVGLTGPTPSSIKAIKAIEQFRIENIKALEQSTATSQVADPDEEDFFKQENIRKVIRSMGISLKSFKKENLFSSEEVIFANTLLARLQLKFDSSRQQFKKAKVDFDTGFANLDKFNEFNELSTFYETKIPDLLNLFLTQTTTKGLTENQAFLSTKTNLKAFTDQLKNETDSIKRLQNISDTEFARKIGLQFKEGLAIHDAHKEHSMGHIKILTNENKKIKEIIIEPFATNEDILKLAHALHRENGILVDLEGNEIFTVKKGSNNERELILKLLKLFEKIGKNHVLRLLYKSNNPIGGHFVGGAFTQPIYGFQNIRHILTNKFSPIPEEGFHGLPSILKGRASVLVKPFIKVR